MSQGMEELINQAFLHVDKIGPHVQAGHYDLVGPNGEIILPSVWEKVIEPDWSITMQMWPMEPPNYYEASQSALGGRPPSSEIRSKSSKAKKGRESKFFEWAGPPRKHPK